MDNEQPPRLAKWPFLAGDLILVVFAAVVVWLGEPPIDLWLLLISGVATLAGAILAVMPYVLEYKALVKNLETTRLLSTTATLVDLEKLSRQITGATAQWQSAHELARQTSQTAQQSADRVAAEARALGEFIDKANTAERQHLRVEVDKLHRLETDWLRVCTTILDHIHALFQAAVRSEQPGLIQQLDQFQKACRDAARWVGLVPFEAGPGDPFNPELHQPLNADPPPAPDSIVRQVAATGYRYQGRIVRKVLVGLAAADAPAHPAHVETPTLSTDPPPSPPATDSNEFPSGRP